MVSSTARRYARWVCSSAANGHFCPRSHVACRRILARFVLVQPYALNLIPFHVDFDVGRTNYYLIATSVDPETNRLTEAAMNEIQGLGLHESNDHTHGSVIKISPGIVPVDWPPALFGFAPPGCADSGSLCTYAGGRRIEPTWGTCISIGSTLLLQIDVLNDRCARFTVGVVCPTQLRGDGIDRIKLQAHGAAMNITYGSFTATTAERLINQSRKPEPRQMLIRTARVVCASAALFAAAGCNGPPQNVTCDAIRSLAFGQRSGVVRERLGAPLSIFTGTAIRENVNQVETEWNYQRDPSLFIIKVKFHEDRLSFALIAWQPFPMMPMAEAVPD
jgi:hypothetical protein